MIRYYPLGTVVRLDADPKRFYMIAGYLPQREDGTVFDYFSVPFPLGMTDENRFVCFYHRAIAQVIAPGYDGPETQQLLDGFETLGGNLMNMLLAGQAQQEEAGKSHE